MTTKKATLKSVFLTGLLVLVPLAITLWVLGLIIGTMDQTLLLLPPSYRPQALMGFALPGLGAVFAFIVVLLTGLLVTNLVGRRLVGVWEDVLNRIPIVRSVYGGVKSFAESVFSQSNSFRKVVMIQYPREGVWSIGFMTAEDVFSVTLAPSTSGHGSTSAVFAGALQQPDLTHVAGLLAMPS